MISILRVQSHIKNVVFVFSIRLTINFRHNIHTFFLIYHTTQPHRCLHVWFAQTAQQSAALLHFSDIKQTPERVKKYYILINNFCRLTVVSWSVYPNMYRCRPASSLSPTSKHNGASWQNHYRDMEVVQKHTHHQALFVQSPRQTGPDRWRDSAVTIAGLSNSLGLVSDKHGLVVPTPCRNLLGARAEYWFNVNRDVKMW